MAWWRRVVTDWTGRWVIDRVTGERGLCVWQDGSGDVYVKFREAGWRRRAGLKIDDNQQDECDRTKEAANAK